MREGENVANKDGYKGSEACFFCSPQKDLQPKSGLELNALLQDSVPWLSQEGHLSYTLDFTEHAPLILHNLKTQKSWMCSFKALMQYNRNGKLKKWTVIVTLSLKTIP